MTWRPRRGATERSTGCPTPWWSSAPARPASPPPTSWPSTGDPVVVVEADDVVGGISRTVERDGWRFDIGGHRFFTKVQAVEDLWHEILPPEDFLLRPRMSRIFYEGKYYDYPLKATNALQNLGSVGGPALRGCSYAWARVRPPEDQTNYEGWLAARFGWRLYRTFFKTYTEKVWGVPVPRCPPTGPPSGSRTSISARPSSTPCAPAQPEGHHQPHRGVPVPEVRPGDDVGALPGPGREGRRHGARWRRRSPPSTVEGGRATAVTVGAATARTETRPPRHVISSMPMHELVELLDPRRPTPCWRRHRPALPRLPDGRPGRARGQRASPTTGSTSTRPRSKVGRIQNFGSWSPYMVKDGRTCLGLEYFVFEGDELWTAPTTTCRTRQRRSSAARPGPARDVEAGYVVRMPKAYPYYDADYQANVATVVDTGRARRPTCTVGRNGMHRVQQPGPLDVHGHADGREHPRRRTTTSGRSTSKRSTTRSTLRLRHPADGWDRAGCSRSGSTPGPVNAGPRADPTPDVHTGVGSRKTGRNRPRPTSTRGRCLGGGAHPSGSGGWSVSSPGGVPSPGSVTPPTPWNT